jgi:hypothetical protein
MVHRAPPRRGTRPFQPGVQACVNHFAFCRRLCSCPLSKHSPRDSELVKCFRIHLFNLRKFIF